MGRQDAFTEIYELVGRGEFVDALRCLYDSSDGLIKQEFQDDMNHAWYVVGNIHFRMGEFDAALVGFKKALEYRPSDFEAYWALGNTYSELGDFVEAEVAFRKALDSGKNIDNLMYNIGNALFDQKKYKEAIEYYKQIVTLDEDLKGKIEKNIKTANKRESKGQTP